jgi:autoinducer 2-degrading protein
VSKIHLFVSVDIRPGKYDEFLQKLTTHVETIRHEEGCLEINIFAEGENRDQLHLWEVWSSQESWSAHMENENSAQWRIASQDLVVGETIKVLHSA